MMNHSITIAIPILNAIETLHQCLAAVEGYPTLIIDNGSTDGTEKLAQASVPWFANPKRVNIAAVRKALAKACKTEFILYVDSDIVLNESIPALLEHLIDPKREIGMVGYRIGNDKAHLQMGNALLRTKVARKINWCAFPELCNCLNARHCLEDMGLTTIQLPSTNVIHLKRSDYPTLHAKSQRR